MRELLACDDDHARAAAVQQLRYRHTHQPDAPTLLRKAANDPNGIVRMEAAIAASYVGTKDALDAMLEVFKHPHGGHLDYAILCALGSHTLKPHWEGNPRYDVAKWIRQSARADELREPKPTPSEAAFDKQKQLKVVTVSCIPERMLFTVDRFIVAPGQAVKLVFTNPDATDHNLVIVKPDALVDVGTAANEMARDPKNANSDFIPADKRHLILHATPMVGETRRQEVAVLRFTAPTDPGVYPFLCTFPGHWVVMKGDMVVAATEAEAEKLLAARKPAVVKQWKVTDFPQVETKKDDATVVRGMRAFLKANCHQCHAIAGHGVNLGPDLCNVSEGFKGDKLLRQILEPSAEIADQYRIQRLTLNDGRTVTGVIVKQEAGEYHVIANLLAPTVVNRLAVKDVDEKVPSRTSPMPEGLLNVLTRDEIVDLLSFLEVGYNLPAHLKHEVFPPAKK
jgi:putative heme-binding domain-containing protein